MDKDELQAIITAHGKWLLGQDGGIRANLAGVDLSGTDLQGVNLEDAILTGANLERAKLKGANLTCAYLKNANLEDAILTGANLAGTYLKGANLTGAILTGANLERANLDVKVLQVGPIGSRKDYIVYNVTKDIVQCGCWLDYKGGSLDMFEQRVNDIYGADNKFGNEYRRVIVWFKAERDATNLIVPQE